MLPGDIPGASWRPACSSFEPFQEPSPAVHTCASAKERVLRLGNVTQVLRLGNVTQVLRLGNVTQVLRLGNVTQVLRLGSVKVRERNTSVKVRKCNKLPWRP